MKRASRRKRSLANSCPTRITKRTEAETTEIQSWNGAVTIYDGLVSSVALPDLIRMIQGAPRRAGICSMMRFGGALTLNGLVVYVACNVEKVLLGRFWGVDALGIYGRAYQLINISSLDPAPMSGQKCSALSEVSNPTAGWSKRSDPGGCWRGA